MRVLFVTSHRDSLISIRPEAEFFIGLARSGVAVTVMTQADSVYAGRMRQAGITVIDFEPRHKVDWAAIRAVRRELRRGGHDILHLFNNKAIANGNLAAVGLPVRVVTYRGRPGNIHRHDPSCYLTHLNPRVDKIVCVSNTVRDSLLPVVFDRSKLVTVYKGHDLSWYADVVPISRDEIRVPASAFLVVCVGNKPLRKGVPTLLEAATLLPEGPEFWFALAGSGMDEATLAPLLKGHGVGSRFRYLGHRRDVLRIVAASDVSVLPTTGLEGLPKTVIETMALGITPVVTDSGGSAELVLNGECGLVVPRGDARAIADALKTLATDRERCRAMGRAARERIATSFRVADTVAGHLRLYRELLGGK
jgi:glycosyltransferase involved in cell wall biosynthesis